MLGLIFWLNVTALDAVTIQVKTTTLYVCMDINTVQIVLFGHLRIV